MITVVLFIVVAAVTGVLFTGWVFVSAARSVWRFAADRSTPEDEPAGPRRCGNPGCRTANPVHARFCRRCGSAVAPPVAMQGSFRPVELARVPSRATA